MRGSFGKLLSLNDVMERHQCVQAIYVLCFLPFLPVHLQLRSQHLSQVGGGWLAQINKVAENTSAAKLQRELKGRS